MNPIRFISIFLIISSYAFIITLVFLSENDSAFSQAMHGTNYRIQFDSLNSGGGYSTSTNYAEQDTLGEQATGYVSSSNYKISAGYQQPDNYIAISSPGNLSFSIGGLGGETASGTLGWKVTTDSAGGYTLYTRSTSTPAMKSASNSFSDYPIKSSPDYVYTVPAASSTFGFSPEGSDIVARYKDNGSACNTGTNDTIDRCFDGFTTSNTLVSQSTSPNAVAGGATTTMRFKAGVGSNKIQDSGVYNATIVMTAIAP